MAINIAETTLSTTIQTTVSTIVSVIILSSIGIASVIKAQELSQNVLIPYITELNKTKNETISETIYFN